MPVKAAKQTHPLLQHLSPEDADTIRRHLSLLTKWRRDECYELLRKAASNVKTGIHPLR